MFAAKRALGIAVLGLVAGLAGSACDDDDDQLDVVVLDPPADAIDTNGDLVVSESEWDDAFDVWDVNDDDLLTDQEFLFNAAAFTDLDVDGSALISEAEWDAAFDDWDLDDDGFLDFTEFDPWI